MIIKRWGVAVLAALAAGCVDFTNAQDAFCAKRPDICGSASDGGGLGSDAGSAKDAGASTDSGAPVDGGATPDAGAADAGPVDAGPPTCTPACSLDGGLPDGGALPPHMIYTCVAPNTCGITCQPLFGDCDADAGDGCEQPLVGDTFNCGACGHRCGNANTAMAPTCSASGTCNITCQPNYANCDGLDQTGCEAALWADPANCGVCGFTCPGTTNCVTGGVCQLTNNSERVWSTDGDSTAFIQDATTLYWTNTTPFQVRAMNKDGSNLRTLYGVDGGPFEIPGLCGPYLAVDATHIYMCSNANGPTFYVGDKSQGDTSGVPPVPFTGPGVQTLNGLFVDVAPGTGAAQHLAWTSSAINRGIWRLDLTDGGSANLDLSTTAGDPVAFSQFGPDIFWGYGSSLEFRKLDISATPTAAAVLGTSGGIGFYATTSDGVNLYFYSNVSTCCDVWQIDSNKNLNNMAHCPGSGGGAYTMATDTTAIYLGAGDIFKAPINSAGSTCVDLLQRSVLPSQASARGIVVDSDAVYFATSQNIYRIHK